MAQRNATAVAGSARLLGASWVPQSRRPLARAALRVRLTGTASRIGRGGLFDGHTRGVERDISGEVMSDRFDRRPFGMRVTPCSVDVLGVRSFDAGVAGLPLPRADIGSRALLQDADRQRVRREVPTPFDRDDVFIVCIGE